MVGIQPIVRAAQQVAAELKEPPPPWRSDTAQPHISVAEVFERFAQLLSVTEPFVDQTAKPDGGLPPQGAQHKPAPIKHGDLLREAARAIDALCNRIGPWNALSRNDTDYLSRLVDRMNDAADQ